MARILLAQPDAALATVLERRLSADRYEMHVVHNGHEALQQAKEQGYDLLIIDLELPALDGFDLIRQIRDAEVVTPVLATTASGEVDQRVRALDCGADDCVVKPIWYSEMTARMRALLRRRRDGEQSVLRVHDLELNRLKRTVARAGSPVELTPKEFALLEYLMRNAGQRVTRSMIVEHVWKTEVGSSATNIIDVYVNYTELMLSAVETSSPLHRNLTEVIKASDRAGALTQQLLTFGRQQVLQPRRIDLNCVILDTEPLLRRLVGEDIELQVRASHPLGQVKADPGQVLQILLNLAANARDAMPSGGCLTIETANVTIQAENSSNQATAPGEYVMLAVSDTGVGMDAATKARIFEPFFTTKELGRGTGLGLSTVYGIVKQSGGDIWVYSEPNQGTCLKIYLPRLDATPSQTTASPALSSAVRGGTVLLAEDELAARELIGEFLTRRGFRVIAAANASEAVKLCLQNKGVIDVLVSDVNMPGLSGPDLAKFAVSLNPRIRTIYMSGYTNGTVTGSGVVTEHCYLQKPFSLSALEQLLRQGPSNDSPQNHEPDVADAVSDHALIRDC